MKVGLNLSEKVYIEAEGDTCEDIFRQLAKLVETFSDLSGGAKGDNKFTDVVPRVRKVQDDEFFEFYSPSTFAKLEFGKRKEGGELYPKRMEVDNKGKAVKDDDGKGVKRPDNGWIKWDFDKQCNV